MILCVSCQTNDDYVTDNIGGMQFQKAKPVKDKHPVFVVRSTDDNGNTVEKSVVENHINRRPEKLGVYMNEGQGFYELYNQEIGWQILVDENTFVGYIQEHSARLRTLEAKVQTLENEVRILKGL